MLRFILNHWERKAGPDAPQLFFHLYRCCPHPCPLTTCLQCLLQLPSCSNFPIISGFRGFVHEIILKYVFHGFVSEWIHAHMCADACDWVHVEPKRQQGILWAVIGIYETPGLLRGFWDLKSGPPDCPTRVLNYWLICPPWHSILWHPLQWIQLLIVVIWDPTSAHSICLWAKCLQVPSCSVNSLVSSVYVKRQNKSRFASTTFLMFSLEVSTTPLQNTS